VSRPLRQTSADLMLSLALQAAMKSSSATFASGLASNACGCTGNVFATRSKISVASEDATASSTFVGAAASSALFFLRVAAAAATAFLLSSPCLGAHSRTSGRCLWRFRSVGGTFCPKARRFPSLHDRSFAGLVVFLARLDFDVALVGPGCWVCQRCLAKCWRLERRAGRPFRQGIIVGTFPKIPNETKTPRAHFRTGIGI
jgi:hypothetical protein